MAPDNNHIDEKIKWSKEAGEVPEFLVPQAILQPPDYFTGSNSDIENNNISQVIVVGDWKIVSGESVYAVDSSGKILKLPESLGVNRTPDTRTILEKITKYAGTRQYVSFTSGFDNSTNVIVPELLEQEYPDMGDPARKGILINLATVLRSKNVDIRDNNKWCFMNAVQSVVPNIPREEHIPATISNTNEEQFVVSNSKGQKQRIAVSNILQNWRATKLDSEPNTEFEEVTLDSKLKVRKYAASKARILNESGRQLAVLSDPKPSIDHEDNNTIWFVDDGKVVSLSGEKMAAGSFEFTEAKLPAEIGKCLSVDTDPHGNFLIVTHEADTGKKISFLDKKTLNIVEEVEGVNKPPVVDQDGNVLFIDTNNQLRIVVTNFNHFPSRYGSKIAEIQERRVAKLRAEIANLQLPEVDTSTAMPTSAESVTSGIDQAGIELQQKLNSIFSPNIEAAQNDADIQRLRLQLQKTMEKPELQPYGAIAANIERQLDIKTAKMRANKLGVDLGAVTTQIPMVQSLEGSIALGKELERLQNLRNETNFLLIDPEETKRLQEQLKTVESEVQRIQLGFQGELVASLQAGFGEVQAILGSAHTMMELEEARKDPAVRTYMERLQMVGDAKVRTEIRRQWSSAVEARQQEIETILATRGESRKARAAELAADIEGSFRSLERNIEGLLRESGGIVNLNAWKEGSAAVADVREQIRQLPGEYQEGYFNRIEELILQKQKAYKQREAGDKKETRTKGATVKFGQESFPIYQSPLLNVTPGWIPLVKDQTSKNDKGQLVFSSTTGEKWKTGEYMVMNMDDPKRQERYEALKKKADRRFNPERHVPEMPDDMVLSPYQEQKLEEMAKLFRRQLGYDKSLVRVRKPRGITIIKGDAGAGKDFSLEIFAAATNREITSVPCRFSMDPEDLTSEYRFNPKRGTFRVPSKFAQSLSKPGQIVNFIEINTMPPEISKLLNSVFDFKRKLYFTQTDDPDALELNLEGFGSEIKVADDLIFVGTMNENYLGTRPLPQEFKDRGRFMDYDYPPYRVAKNSSGEEERLPVEQTSVPSGFTEMKLRADEAMILAKHLDSLKSLSTDEFKKLWDHKINRQAGNGADMFETTQRTKDIEDLNQIVKIANKMRQAYRAFQNNDAGAEVFEFIFSIRTSQDIVAELAETGTVKAAIKEVVLPKISDAEQRKRALDIINTS